MGALTSFFFPSNAELCQNAIDDVKNKIYLKEREAKRVLEHAKKLFAAYKSCDIEGEKKILLSRIDKQLDRHLFLCNKVATLEVSKMKLEDLKTNVDDVDSIHRETELIRLMNFDFVDITNKISRNNLNKELLHESVQGEEAEDIGELRRLELRFQGLVQETKEPEKEVTHYVFV